MDETDQIVLDTTARLFAELAEGPPGRPLAELWQSIEQMGLPLALLPPAQGGVGGHMAQRIIRLSGKFALATPLAETMLGHELLSAAGLGPAEGPLTIALDDTLSLTREEGAWRLSGHAAAVPWGEQSNIVALARTGSHIFIAFIPAGEAESIRGSNLAGEPRDLLTFDQELSTSRVAEIACAPENLHARMALLRAQAIAGAIEQVVELTTTYALERVQFGRPIAKFQVIQHALAVMAGHSAAATAAADMALDELDGTDRLAIAVAKARTSEAAGHVAAMAHQIHGAMGFTREYPLHLLTTRLWSWRDEFGNETYWYRHLGGLASRAPDLWPFLLREVASQ